MTIKSIKDPDFMHWQVRDLDTGELVDNVEWVDDDFNGAGRAAAVVRVLTNGGTLRSILWGNFRLEDKREKDSLLEALEGARKIVAFFEALVEEREAWRAGG